MPLLQRWWIPPSHLCSHTAPAVYGVTLMHDKHALCLQWSQAPDSMQHILDAHQHFWQRTAQCPSQLTPASSLSPLQTPQPSGNKAAECRTSDPSGQQQYHQLCKVIRVLKNRIGHHWMLHNEHLSHLSPENTDSPKQSPLHDCLAPAALPPTTCCIAKAAAKPLTASSKSLDMPMLSSTASSCRPSSSQTFCRQSVMHCSARNQLVAQSGLLHDYLNGRSRRLTA